MGKSRVAQSIPSPALTLRRPDSPKVSMRTDQCQLMPSEEMQADPACFKRLRRSQHCAKRTRRSTSISFMRSQTRAGQSEVLRCHYAPRVGRSESAVEVCFTCEVDWRLFGRQFANARERFSDELRGNTKSVGHQRIENGPERRQRADLASQDQQAKCAANRESTCLGDLSTQSFVDEQHVGVDRLGKENGRGLTGIESKIDQRQLTVVDTYPVCVPDRLDARCRRSPRHDFVPDRLGNDDVAIYGGQKTENPRAGEVDER